MHVFSWLSMSCLDRRVEVLLHTSEWTVTNNMKARTMTVNNTMLCGPNEGDYVMITLCELKNLL